MRTHISRLCTSSAALIGLICLTGCGTSIGPPARSSDRPPVSQERIAEARARLPRQAPRRIDVGLDLMNRPLTAFPALREWSVTETVVDALARIGPDAIEPLVTTLASDDPEVRARAAQALARMGPTAEPAVPALIQALSDEDPRVRQAAARALGQIGPAARSAVPALIRTLRAEAQHAADRPD